MQLASWLRTREDEEAGQMGSLLKISMLWASMLMSSMLEIYRPEVSQLRS